MTPKELLVLGILIAFLCAVLVVSLHFVQYAGAM